jgi:hypothetical protein
MYQDRYTGDGCNFAYGAYRRYFSSDRAYFWSEQHSLCLVL